MVGKDHQQGAVPEPRRLHLPDQPSDQQVGVADLEQVALPGAIHQARVVAPHVVSEQAGYLGRRGDVAAPRRQPHVGVVGHQDVDVVEGRAARAPGPQARDEVGQLRMLGRVLLLHRDEGIERLGLLLARPARERVPAAQRRRAQASERLLDDEAVRAPEQGEHAAGVVRRDRDAALVGQDAGQDGRRGPAGAVAGRSGVREPRALPRERGEVRIAARIDLPGRPEQRGERELVQGDEHDGRARAVDLRLGRRRRRRDGARRGGRAGAGQRRGDGEAHQRDAPGATHRAPRAAGPCPTPSRRAPARRWRPAGRLPRAP